MAVAVKDLVSVFKLRIAVAIMLSALAGSAVASGTAPDARQLVVLALATLFSAGAAGAFNQFVERSVDARMARTRARPFVTGRYRTGPLWLAVILVVLAVALAMAAWALNPFVALHLFLGAFVYGVVYTVWLKPRTAWNIVLGGAAGSFAVLAGASAVDPSLPMAPILLALVLFLWTPPHFWSLATVYRADYAAAGVPMLPVVAGERVTARVCLIHTASLVALSFAPLAFGMSWIYLAGAALGGLYFLKTSVGFLRQPSGRSAAANFRASLIQLAALELGAIVDRLALA